MSDANFNNFEKLLSRPFTPTPFEDKSHSGDAGERLEVIYKLKQRTAHIASDGSINLDGTSLTLEAGSTLHQALQPGIASLKKLEEKPEFQAFLAKLRLTGYSAIQVTGQGEIIIEVAGRRQRFSSAALPNADLNEDVAVLVEMATLTGGTITSGDRGELLQWLKFHRYNIPQTGADAQMLLGFLQLEYPASPPSGNYREMLLATADSAAQLSPEQCVQIRALTKRYTGGESLLETLSDAVVGGRNFPFQRTEANDVLHKIVSSPIGVVWAKAYIKDLAWYGARENEPMADEQLHQMLLTAVLLDLHPSIEAPEPRNHTLGFNLYCADHIEQSFAFVQTQLEKHLLEYHRISQQNVALAAHLLLAGTAPEFLVRDLPASVLLGTPQWVDFCRAVAVVEINAPGSSRTVTYARLQQLMKYGSVSEPQQTLNALAAVDPVIDWALLNSIVTMDEVNASTQQALEAALAAYDRYSQQAAETAQALSVPLPTRKAVARSILEFAAPDCDYLDENELYQKRNFSYQDANVEPLAMSLVDLHMSNDLATGDWDLKRAGSVYTQFAHMQSRLAPPDGVFQLQFNRAYVTYTDSMATQLKLTLSSLPLIDRTRLLRGKVSCFTLRPSVASPGLLDPIATIISPPGGLRDLIFLENQKDKDAATGRYGVVMCSEYEHQLYCYELFTLHGECRENPQLAELIKDKGLLKLPAREYFFDSMTRNFTPEPVYQLPTDLECYTHGVPPGLVSSSQGVIEKLTVLAAITGADDLKSKGYYQCFYAGEFDRLANLVLKHRPIATYDELVKECWGQTRLEKRRQDREEQFDTFLNIVVPFKSCIEDLRSDDPDRRREGLGMCVIETAMTLLLVVGMVARIALIAAKAGTTAAKSARMAKAGILLLNGLFNPVDGVPDLLRGGAKLLYRGVHRFHNTTTLLTTVSDLRKLTGGAPYGGLRTVVDPGLIRLGKWRQTPDAADLFNIWGIRHNEQWYALSRHGKPWGPTLHHFKPHKLWHLFNLDKLMPASYTRKLLKDALPVSRNKIDTAIQALTDPSFTTDSGQVVKMLLGDNSVQGRNKLLGHLQDVKRDIAKVTPENFFIEKVEDNTIAALSPELYKEWMNLPSGEASRKKFMVVYTDMFNKQFRTEGYSHEVLADDLIHELFHGAPDTFDHAYAHTPVSGRQGNYQRLNVKDLLNLASGHIKDASTLKTVKPFDNAESFMLTTSLLNQLTKEPEMYRQNMIAMQKALERSKNHKIDWEVLLRLNPV
ncbi:hypothetical protein PseAD21_13450 [Pseudomonas sp. AD21]|uniref:hypothetical protein n=1 Tax=Pseudomonas sp. AD21 TaxID=396378 RepID=UPI000C85E5FE|nr:hypothetical protein [Pseudomonas sp. AD21]PMQ11196.1 hypothetical protein PseAD21_13450 [Pseudomonas sp. AD21]